MFYGCALRNRPIVQRADTDIDFDDTLRQGYCCRVSMQLMGSRRGSRPLDDFRVITDGTPTAYSA